MSDKEDSLIAEHNAAIESLTPEQQRAVRRLLLATVCAGEEAPDGAGYGFLTGLIAAEAEDGGQQWDLAMWETSDPAFTVN